MSSGRYLAASALVSIVLLPMLIAVLFRNALEACDYASQAGLLLMTVTFPFVAPVHWRTPVLFLLL